MLRSLLQRILPAELRAKTEAELDALGALTGGELYCMQLEDRLREPTLTHWDPWGNRIDRIELTPLWKRAAQLTAEFGMVSTGYDASLGRWARVLQFAKVYLFAPASDVYTCPLAMTDGAARTLLTHGNQPLIERALPRLLSRDSSQAWTSGQWMTERTGGSDVSRTETVAKRDGDQWRLYGTKWFSSATTSEMALTLARPEGNPPGGKGLALFYLETRDAQGRLNHLQVHRLKDKLGTRKVPTAELGLEGTIATPVIGTSDGVKHITPMLNITRTWNAICAAGGMRRSVALVRDYARKREAFGAFLQDKPLHLDTVAGLHAETEAAMHFVFRIVELLGAAERGEANEREMEVLRIATPLAKLVTGKQAVTVASEALECFGGAGYVEDTGLPVLLRDAQVLPIWEGTTNVLSLDVLRVLARGDALGALREEVWALTDGCEGSALEREARAARAGIDRARAWAMETSGQELAALEAGARRFALTLGRCFALALMVRHARWAQEQGDERSVYAARRFLRNGVDALDGAEVAREESKTLAMEG